MDNHDPPRQDPAPGRHLVKFCGDTLTFTLTVPQSENGTAWVRTNIGQAAEIRRETLRNVEQDDPPLGRAWFDIPMQRRDAQTFTVTLPLCESGHFEAKCFFLAQGRTTPLWPSGANTVINVDSADACCANIVYNAFVRQFGPNKAGGKMLGEAEGRIIGELDNVGYTVIPPSGKFRDLIKELDFIIGELGCRILMLLPIHPTPTTYGRMGRFGSPYAALSFTAVDPALAEFDPHATPLEQFIELVDATHRRNAKIFIDIAINHTGWAADLHESHPKWLVRGPEGKIEVPGAWGVSWEDLTKLDYRHRDLWGYMADVFLTWCHRGVDGFRCDAGYMLPVAAWKYIIARIRDQYPQTIFVLEGLGGKISVTRELLDNANLNWAYSELFQNYDRGQIEKYLPEAIAISTGDGIAVHFAETHDNPRLAGRSAGYARMRTALCALASHQGAYGFANGVEWFATEKINVHNSPSLNWGAEFNQVDHIRRLNRLLKIHPAFHTETELKMVQQGGGNHIVLLRHHLPTAKKLLVIVNLDAENPTTASWNPALTGIRKQRFIDLLSGAEVTITSSENWATCPLEPGQALCLSPDQNDLALIENRPSDTIALPRRIERQRLRAKALEVVTVYSGYRDLREFDPDQAAEALKKDPLGFCAGLNIRSEEPGVITWTWPQDVRREVMLPPGHFLLIKANAGFRARMTDGARTLECEDSLPGSDGSHFALFTSIPAVVRASACTLKIAVYAPEGCQHQEAKIRVLPRAEAQPVRQVFQRPRLLQKNLQLLATNGRGAMLKTPVCWGVLTSRYDALLAANINPDYPENRWIMLTRCRAWMVYQDYSQEINSNCLEAFGSDDFSGGHWQFHVPAGQGENVLLTMSLAMVTGENTVRLSFYRHPSRVGQKMLDDTKAIKIILRPDIESRSFHDTTKAYTGPEHRWSQAVSVNPDGFVFKPDDAHRLEMQIAAGNFVWEPEWQYMVHRAVDAQRGMDPDSDLYSPGYFVAYLKSNQAVTLTAAVSAGVAAVPLDPAAGEYRVAVLESEDQLRRTPMEILERSLEHYVVARGELQTVIAGYPWFLDWGRDALIFARGLIAAKKTQTARAILTQFGQFEDHGTLPNMIVGQNAGNRDTSDAPLWFATACADLLRAEKNRRFLDAECGRRSVREILLSIGRSIVDGTPNGIRMDADSALVFSPVHFTWMDTNHPAGTPREGYPIEIQALWYAALRLLAKIDASREGNRWKNLSARVKASILNHFWLRDLGYLADCLHAPSGHPAAQAAADDALRPNQLLAITLGAVSDKAIIRQILAACEELLVPGAIRSLADRPLRRPLEIVHNGKRLNDPHRPYQGKYEGDEDTRRKPAYHNGTAWTWLFPSYCEAWVRAYGNDGKQTAAAWLDSSASLLEQGCIGHIPEILDGDFPHAPRGCDAQAWGVSELLRVWHLLQD